MLQWFRLSPTQVCQQGACFLVLSVIFSTLSPAPASQAQALIETFPAAPKQKVVIINAPKVSISAWDKKQVAVAASAPTQVTEEEITMQSIGGRLEIICHAAPDKSIMLTLRLPATATLEWKTYGHRVDIREPAGTINLTASKTALHLDVPVRAQVDVKEAGNVSMHLKQTSASAGASAAADARPGTGPPYVTVTARTAQVLVSNGPLPSQPPRPSANASQPSQPRPSYTAPAPSMSQAARAIAGRGGAMGQALRRSHPQLIQSDLSAGGSTSPAAAKKPGEDEAIKLETHLINLNVSVTDRGGRAITGLKQGDFSVFEDNEPQKISFFVPEQSPFNLVLLLDMSGSVKSQIELIKEAALHFLDIIGPQDSVAVITFTSDVSVVSPLTRDRDLLREKIRNLRTPVGGTAFYDALAYVLADVLAGVKGQRNAVIALTDGQDSSVVPSPALPGGVTLNLGRGRGGSYLTFEQLLDGVMEADAIIYPIHIQSESGAANLPLRLLPPGAQIIVSPSAVVAELGRRQLEELAQASGGKFFSAARIDELQGIYNEVAAEMRTVYTVAYTPKNETFDGKFRRVRVKVNRDDAAVRTRRGYYAR